MLTKYVLIVPIVMRKIVLCVGLIVAFFNASAQDFSFPRNKQKQSISFRIIKNLIIIPLYINDKGPYNFVLDTGVGPLIITDPSIIDSVNFTTMRQIKIAGLGLETITAYVSQSINTKIGRAEAKHIPTAVLKEDLFNLSGHLGIKIYGLIGFNFFNSFIVDIRYSENRIIFSDPEMAIKQRGTRIPLVIENQKPYINGAVEVQGKGKIDTRFLMDTGASHALSLEMLNGKSFPEPSPKIKANLGMSLSGQIKGYVGRVKAFYLGKYVFKDVVSAFPDFESIAKKIDLSTRNGNLGSEILKKFDIQLNYQGGYMNMKPNAQYKAPFEHDMLGMVIYLDQNEYKRVIIGEIDEDSPAEKAGLCAQDEIIGVNFKPIEFYSLNDLTEMFKSKPNSAIIFEIFRDNKVIFKVAHLEKRI